MRTKIENVFNAIQRVFGFAKGCYRGLAKNVHHLFVTCALADLFLVRHCLLRFRGASCDC